jgi:hypothetical protein
MKNTEFKILKMVDWIIAQDPAVEKLESYSVRPFIGCSVYCSPN